jgi:hypothetical protein
MSHFTPKYYVKFSDNIVTVLANSKEEAEIIAKELQIYNNLSTDVLAVSTKNVLKHGRLIPFTNA